MYYFHFCTCMNTTVFMKWYTISILNNAVKNNVFFNLCFIFGLKLQFFNLVEIFKNSKFEKRIQLCNHLTKYL